MNTRYDVAILGCGEAGIFAGYELMRHAPGLKVVALDQGADIYTRSCPIVAGKVKECVHCKVCATMCGFGGAGAFSDGKYNFTTAFGGWLTDFMPREEVMALIDYVDSINMKHGATDQVFSTGTPAARALEKKALEFDLHLLQARCKHLGTENNLKILQSLGLRGGGGVHLGGSPMGHIDGIHILNELHDLLGIHEIGEPAAERGGEVEFAVGEGAGAPKAAHGVTDLTLDAVLHLSRYNGTAPAVNIPALLQDHHPQPGIAFHQFITRVDTGLSTANDGNVVSLAHDALFSFVCSIHPE